MKIALDIDGVLADTTEIMRVKVAEKFRMSPELIRPGDDYVNIYKFEDERIQNKVNKYARQLFNEDPEVYEKAEEIQGAWFGSRIVEPIAYITRRPAGFGIDHATTQWLESRHFFPAPVHFVPKGTCKSTVAKEIGADILFEDSPAEIASCRENNLRIVIFKYPYNLDQIRPDSEVVLGWRDLIDNWLPNNKPNRT